MKLPVSIAYMKWGEYVPEIWNMSLTGVADTADEQNILPKESITPGKAYKIEELIHYALIYSDNSANETLIENLPKEIIYKVFTDLSLPIIDQLEA